MVRQFVRHDYAKPGHIDACGAAAAYLDLEGVVIRDPLMAHLIFGPITNSQAPSARFPRLTATYERATLPLET